MWWWGGFYIPINPKVLPARILLLANLTKQDKLKSKDQNRQES